VLPNPRTPDIRFDGFSTFAMQCYGRIPAEHQRHAIQFARATMWGMVARERLR
jgi:hypothetical protein